MLNFLGNRLQKSIKKMNKKTILSEVDLIEVSREIKITLLEADVNLLVVKQFMKNVQEKAIGSKLIGKLNPGQQMIKIVKEELVHILGGSVKLVKLSKKPTVIMMVGLQGSGKTTTSGKIASYFKRKKEVKNPLLVAADIYRPAAIEQLKTLAKLAKINIFEKGISIKPQIISKQAIDFAWENNHDLVILDTAGRLAINEALMQELENIKKIVRPDEIFFVVDALSGQDVINVAKIFHARLTLTGLVITKLDSDARGGSALSLSQLLNIPIRFIGTGEKLANLDLFYPERMASRILGMGDVLSLIENASEVIDEKKSKKMMHRLMKGHFDLEDLLSNLKQVKKLGKMSKLLAMIPGAAAKIDASKVGEAEKKIKVYEILISSMTMQERKSPKLLKNAARKTRILSGSGRTIQEYNLLIFDFDKMFKQVKQMSKQMKDKNFDPSMMNEFKKF